MCFVLICVLVILIIFIIIKLFFYNSTPKEYFNWDRYAGKDSVSYYNVPCDHNKQDIKWIGKSSLDCYKESKNDCLKFSNCGICHKNCKLKCIPGDGQGPLFDDSCQNWTFTDYYDNYIFGEKETKTVRPWSHFIPESVCIFPSPIARASLQSFKEQS